MRRDFFETLRLFCVLGALLIIGLVIFSALVAGCKPATELQCSEAGKSNMTCFRIVTVDGHDYILAKDRDYYSIAIAHHGGCRKCAEERRRAVYEDMFCASTGNEGNVANNSLTVECMGVECMGVSWTNIASLCGVDGKSIPRAMREDIDIEKLKNEAVAEGLRNRDETVKELTGRAN